jgi:hypothetical protein
MSARRRARVTSRVVPISMDQTHLRLAQALRKQTSLLTAHRSSNSPLRSVTAAKRRHRSCCTHQNKTKSPIKSVRVSHGVRRHRTLWVLSRAWRALAAGNFTGFTRSKLGLRAKWLELFKLAPGINPVGVLARSSGISKSVEPQLDVISTQKCRRSIRGQLTVIEAGTIHERLNEV